MTNFLRLGSANAYDTALRNIVNRQTSLANLQENLTAGKRVVRASDDPTAAAQAERAITRAARIDTDQRALESQKNSISQAEATLSDVNSTLQNFRELAASAGNASLGAPERKAIANQLSGYRDQILALANRKDTNGLPLFSALGSALAPFVGPQALPQDYTFNGLPGQVASNEVSIPYSLDGDRAFMHVPARDGVYNVSLTNVTAPAHEIHTSGVTLTNPALVSGSAYAISITGVDTTSVPGTTTVTYDIAENPNVTGPFSGSASYPSNTAANISVTQIPGLSLSIKGAPAVGDTMSVDPRPSIFSVLDDAINAIGNAPDGNAAQQAVGQALNNVDLGMSQISAVRGQAGDLLNRADRINANQDKRKIQVEGDRSRAEDLDMIKGVSDFQNQQTGYQAALQSYAQVQKLSLFNYLG
ncbi:MAG: flagellar hook-associated protein FlgL [Burkholderiales bacterium]|nr:flagellar hook-associated protein FlgL [Burkholderiales bacterium]